MFSYACHGVMCMWRPEDNFLESIHSGFVYVNLRDNSQVSRLIGKAPLPSGLLSNVQYI